MYRVVTYPLIVLLLYRYPEEIVVTLVVGTVVAIFLVLALSFLAQFLVFLEECSELIVQFAALVGLGFLFGRGDE